MENCYICLEPTDVMIRNKSEGNKCHCKIYVHPSCYDEWLEEKRMCMICKVKIGNKYNFNLISLLINLILKIIISKEFSSFNYIEYMIYTCFAFVMTIFLVVFMYIIHTFCREDKFYEIYYMNLNSSIDAIPNRDERYNQIR